MKKGNLSGFKLVTSTLSHKKCPVAPNFHNFWPKIYLDLRHAIADNISGDAAVFPFFEES